MSSTHSRYQELGKIRFKHGKEIEVFQVLGVGGEDAVPNQIAGKAIALEQIRPALKNLGILLVESLMHGGHVSSKPDTTAVARKIVLRSSLLLPSRGGEILRVPELEERNGKRTKSRSRFRYHFAKDWGREALSGRAEFGIRNPTGVPGLAFAQKEVKMMINLPKGPPKAYTRAVTDPDGPNSLFQTTAEMLEAWSKHPQNMIGVPLVTSGKSPVGVVCFDFDGSLTNVSSSKHFYLDRIRLTLSNFTKDHGRRALQALSWLVTHLP